jgi:radical SAM superfamily enzyme YgiQ (UPF0313 family)
MAILSLTLPGRRAGIVSLKPGSTTLAVGADHVSAWDLAGRPLSLVRGESTWRRSLNGRLLCKRRERTAAGVSVLRVAVPEEAGREVLEAARLEAEEALEALRRDPAAAGDRYEEATARLARLAATGADFLASDAARFREIYRPIGILPPDQYLSRVVQATEGCSWNACTFCALYRDVPFRIKTHEEFAAHTASVREFLGPSLLLRRKVFFGDANALCAAPEQVLPLMEETARAFPVAPRELTGAARRAWLSVDPARAEGIYAFVDAWTGHRRVVETYRAYAELALRRVYVGLETGDPELLAWLNKPGSPDDAVELVHTLREAGVAAGVIVLLGAGGSRFGDRHVRGTSEVLTRMALGPRDLLYFSEFVPEPGLEYHRRADSPDLLPLPHGACAAQRAAILSSYRPADPSRPPTSSTYDIREWVG